MKLSDKQIGFLTEKFFTSQTDMPGAGRIANELLVTGSCTVAGDGRLWNGGVGNFIRAEHAPGAVGCSLLRFDIAGFLSSPWVQEYIARHEADLKAEIADLQASITALQELAHMVQKEPAGSQTNVKEHATLSARARVDHGVEVVTMEDHVNRSADRGCCVSSC